MATSSDSVIVVGAGVFGLSLAHELITNRGYTDVTVLDRFLPPVPDGTSTDISRVIRSEYADPFYSQMAREAIDKWRTSEPFKPHYHESGFAMLATDPDHPYFKEAKEQSAKGGSSLQLFGPDETETKMKAIFPGVQAPLRQAAALNMRGGWADAAGAVRSLAEYCSRKGVSFVTGRHGTVTEFEIDDDASGSRVIKGVKTAAGITLRASRIVLATGAWTGGLVQDVGHAMRGSGQPVGFIQLTSEEAKSLLPMPVMIDMDTGVFVFPPTPDTHVLKVARHGFGYLTDIPATTTSGNGDESRKISAPRTDANNAASGWIPDDASESLREGLRRLVPGFADRPWSWARLCWYNDTPESDFVADDYPAIGGLFIATGGAGHAYKMFPALGGYIADCFENKASAELRHKWRLRSSEGQPEVTMSGDGSRGGPPARLLSENEQAKLL